tara:strand:- start:8310 stop:8651 length:342 start_codon:yes stop_codon:yes gene_type:complete
MAEEAQEVEQNPLHDLVQHALDQDYNKANKVFGDLMGVKVQDALDQEQIKIADKLYNGVDDEVEAEAEAEIEAEAEVEAETDEDQGELDLEDDESEEIEQDEEELLDDEKEVE